MRTPSRFDLTGRVVLVTGGTAGIGRATAKLLHRKGATVVVCGRHEGRLQETVAELPGTHGIRADTTVPEDRASLLAEVLERHGRLDALVLNAGQGWAGLVEDMPAEDVERVIAVNLTATVQLARAALPALLADGGGDLVVMSSIAAWSQVPPLTVYCATKAGVQGFARGLRREVSGRGVRVHTVNPVAVRTEWLARGHGYEPSSDADAHPRLSPGIPPSLVARAVARTLRSPWSREVSVPRISGLARLGEVPPVDKALDIALSRIPGGIEGFADQMVGPRVSRRGEERP
ncbi:short-subunit dehydrogenase [Motilibacter rhizosphaerae]|uniref:Short-subunit dehydrogenase n=1 Tax=Motilibacter rhizosphaerae TaxID=598652 RepID=A0A4Q7NAW8_9ACTN|nr:SDR family oxidoreductase [Motilibacter rhizosphaerae]RZS80015.1 short-subunit dehydrogenase [Motilibacter rhizosphaerae]